MLFWVCSLCRRCCKLLLLKTVDVVCISTNTSALFVPHFCFYFTVQNLKEFAGLLCSMPWSVTSKRTPFTSVLKTVSFFTPVFWKRGCSAALFFWWLETLFPGDIFNVCVASLSPFMNQLFFSCSKCKMFSLEKFSSLFCRKQYYPLSAFALMLSEPNSFLCLVYNSDGLPDSNGSDWCSSIVTSGFPTVPLSPPKRRAIQCFLQYILISFAGLDQLETWQFLSFPCTLCLLRNSMLCWLILFSSIPCSLLLICCRGLYSSI